MARMGATHYLRRLHGLSLMEFHVLPCNLTRVMKIGHPTAHGSMSVVVDMRSSANNSPSRSYPHQRRFHIEKAAKLAK
jgi:hypothetical protein